MELPRGAPSMVRFAATSPPALIECPCILALTGEIGMRTPCQHNKRGLPLRIWPVAFLSIVVLSNCSGSSAPTDAVVRVTERVVCESPHRLGLNIAGTTYYNDQQMNANALLHGGFAKGRQATILRVGEATGASARDINFAPDDTERITLSFAGGRYCVATGKRAGETGTITAHDPATGQFTFEHDGVPFAREDLIWVQGPEVERALPDGKEGERGIGIGDFRPALDPDTKLDYVPAEDKPGDQYLRITFPANGKRVSGGIKHYIRVTPNTTYRFHIRARSETSDTAIGVSLENYAFKYGEPGYMTELKCADTAVGTEWKEYVFTGRTTEDAKVGDNYSAFTFGYTAEAADGGGIYTDWVTMEDETAATESGFNRALVERLQEAQCGVLRFYGAADLGSLVRDFTAANTTEASWTYVSMASFYRLNPTCSVVDDWMRLSRDVQAEPWITVGSVNTPDDWYELISYLAAPADFDDAAQRRAAHGFAEPWTNSFKTIYLEIGNEWWNPIFRPFHTHLPEKYAELCNTIIQRVRAHPHFDPARFRIVVGGWAVNANNWNTRLDAETKGHDLVSIAPYLMHAMDRFDTYQASFGALFADVEGYARDGGARTRDGLRENGKNTRLAVYELNTHVTGGAAPPAAASEVCSSLGAGVAVLDQAMALMQAMGTDPINYFTALQRAYNERAGLWGVFIRDSDGTMRPRPVWHGLRLANRNLIEGNMVAVETEGGGTWDQDENGSVPAMDSVPYLHAYAFLVPAQGGQGRRANLLLVNRSLDAWQHAWVQLPFEPAPGATRILLGGGNIAENNEEEERVTLQESKVDDFWQGMEVAVPPFSALVYQVHER